MPHIQCSIIPDPLWNIKCPDARYEAGMVHVWRLQLSASLYAINDNSLLLTADEMERSKRYMQEKDRQRFILARSVLRQILAKYMDEQPADIQFAVSENNKPYIQSDKRRVHYNVSHSGDYVLIAVSDMHVGIDIEQINREVNFSEILPVCFTDTETAIINGDDDPLKRFYELWTRKESLLKATGKGMDDDIQQVPCTDGRRSVDASTIGSQQDWQVTSFYVAEHYTASLACDTFVKEYRFFDTTAFMPLPLQ